MGVNANVGVGNNPSAAPVAPATGAPLINGTVCLVIDGTCGPTGPLGTPTSPPVLGLDLCIAAPGTCAGTSGAPGTVPLLSGTVCVVVDGSCTPTGSKGFVNGTICLVLDGNCGPAGPVGTPTNPPIAGVNICVAAPGTCNSGSGGSTSTHTSPLASGTICVVIDGLCGPTGPTGTSGNPPVAGGNVCLNIPGTCDTGTPTGTGVGVGVGTPIGGGGACVVVLSTCGTTTTPTPTPIGVEGGTTPDDGTSPSGGITPDGRGTPGGSGTGTGTGAGTGTGTGAGVGIGAGSGLTIGVQSAATTFANPQVALNTDNKNGLCSYVLTPFSRDGGLTGTIIDCANVHVVGQRATGAGYGATLDGPAAGAMTKPLGNSGRVSADLTGTCAGCETAFGSGTGYKSFVQLKDSDTGDFITVSIGHDAGGTGTTLFVETGRKTASGYDIQQGSLPATTNRIPDGHATILLAWTAQGVAVSVNGIIPPNESQARSISVGTYNVRMAQPVVSFGAAAKNGGDRVDTTFKAISFG